MKISINVQQIQSLPVPAFDDNAMCVMNELNLSLDQMNFQLRIKVTRF